MSNWLDVRIKVYAGKEEVMDMYKKFKEMFTTITKIDTNAPINLGSSDSKLVWCAARTYDGFVSIIGYTKVGMSDNNVCAIVKWISGKFPKVTQISIQARDDGSHIFHTYMWKTFTPNTLFVKKIDYDFYPVFNKETIDSYTEETSKAIQKALKEHGIAGVIPVDSFKSEDKLQ